MAENNIFQEAELRFLRALLDHRVDFMLVGLAAATLQGAPVVTQDIDLWISDLTDKKFQAALRSIGAAYVPSFGLNPPAIALAGSELFDLVTHMSGLESYNSEKKNITFIPCGEITLPVLTLERIVKSKEAANREKDRLVLPILKDVLKTLAAAKRVVGRAKK